MIKELIVLGLGMANLFVKLAASRDPEKVKEVRKLGESMLELEKILKHHKASLEKKKKESFRDEDI